MKATHYIALAVALVAATPAATRDYVVVLPQSLDRDTSRQVIQAIDTLIRKSPRGTKIAIFDGTNVKTVANFHIPDDSRADIENLRIGELQVPMADFGKFKRNYRTTSATSADEGEIRLPATLDLLALAYASTPTEDRQVCVLVVGNSRYRGDPAMAMTDGRLPSDGLIFAPRSRSAVYGTADRQRQLDGFAINMLVTDKRQPDARLEGVKRTWSLVAREMGASVVTFSSDFKVSIGRWETCQRKPLEIFEPNATREIETMLPGDPAATAPSPAPPAQLQPAPPASGGDPSVPQVQVPRNDDWITRPEIDPTAKLPVVERAAVKIGVRWGDTGCRNTDVDLHVRVGSGDWLYFGRARTPQGRLVDDLLVAPAGSALEVVELNEIRLADLDIRVNFFRGRCQDMRGVVRAFVGGDVFETPFSIVSKIGAEGRGGREGPAWTTIQAKTLFGQK